MKANKETQSSKRASKAVATAASKKKRKEKVVEVSLSEKKTNRGKKKAAATTKRAKAKATAKKKAASTASTKKVAKASAKTTPKKAAKTAKKASSASTATSQARSRRGSKATSTSSGRNARSVAKVESARTASKDNTKKRASAVAADKKGAKAAKVTKALKPERVVVVPEKAEPAPSEDLTRTQALLSPSMALLKPFREAAKRNRALQKAKEKEKNKRSSFIAKPPRKGKKYSVDLRIHSPASEGFFSTGGVDPAPALVRLARVKGLHAIAITDYYQASFVDPVKEMSENTTLSVIPGLDLLCEVGGCDEISIIALFPEEKSSADLFAVLEELNVPEWAYGRSDYVLRCGFSQVLEIIERHHGVVIPSRVDKTPFRHLAIPTLVEEFGIHCFDLVHPEAPEFFKNNWPDGGFTFFSFSNANALGQIGSRSASIKLSEPGFTGVRELAARRVLN